MMIRDLFNTLTILSLYSGLLLSLYFFASTKGNITGNRILSGLLLTFCLQIVYSYTTSDFAYLNYMQWHKLLFAIKQASFLTGPLIYLYIRSFQKQTKSLSRFDTLHAVPFLVSLIFLLFFYSGKEHFNIWQTGINFFSTLLILIHNLIYLIISIKKLVSLSRQRVVSFAVNNNEYPMLWLRFVALGCIGLWIIQLNAFVIIIIIGRINWCAYTASIYALSIFLFVVLVMLLILVQPEIIYAIAKYQHSDLTDNDKKDYLQKVNDYMTSGKPYREPDFSLQIIADNVGLSSRIVSQVINERYGMNVKTYINEFRLKESMRLLTDPNNTSKTILEILYEVGFNSKSAFNLQFKKFSGLTPQEYRQKMADVES